MSYNEYLEATNAYNYGPIHPRQITANTKNSNLSICGMKESEWREKEREREYLKILFSFSLIPPRRSGISLHEACADWEKWGSTNGDGNADNSPKQSQNYCKQTDLLLSGRVALALTAAMKGGWFALGGDPRVGGGAGERCGGAVCGPQIYSSARINADSLLPITLICHSQQALGVLLMNNRGGECGRACVFS